MQRSRWVVVLASAVALAGVALDRAQATDWTLTLGVEGRVLPSYEGSDRYVLRPVPLIDIRRAGTPRHFSSPRDGASIGLFESGPFRAGLTGKVKLPRREGDDSDLRGLGDVDWTFEGGFFGEFYPVNWLRLRGEIRQGVGGHHGQVADLLADLIAPVTPQLTLSAGPRVSFATAKANEPYFTINATQSALSGLPVYSAGGGLKSYGVGGMARYEWTPRWATHFFVEYERLTGSAADSPITSLRGSPDQVQTGIGVTYSFDVPGLF